MVASRSLVVGVIVRHKLRRVIGQLIDHAARQRVAVIFIVLGALRVQRFTLFKARLLRILGVKIAVCDHAGHVVHRHSSSSLDTGVDGCGVDCHAAPTADADDADALRINAFLHRKEIHRCAEVLGVDVRRCHIAGRTAALTGIGRVEGNREKAQLRHFLRIKAGRLLLHRAKRTADGDGRQLAFHILRHVDVGRQRDAVSVVEGRLAVLNLVAFGKHLVPFLRQMQLFHA